MIPENERRNWIPLRLLCNVTGYNFAHAIDSGWSRSVSNWIGVSSDPELFVIYRDQVEEFREMVQKNEDEEDRNISISEFFITYNEAITSANDSHRDAVERAKKSLWSAIRHARREHVNAIAKADVNHKKARRVATIEFNAAIDRQQESNN